MKTRTWITGSLLMFLLLSLAGCGGGGGGGGAAPVGAPISGVASKGPIKNGHIQIFEIFSSEHPGKARLSATPFFSGTTGADGSYQANLPAGMTSGSIMVKVIDGTYTDEATGSEKQIENEYPGGMRAVYGNISGAVRRGSLSMSVTPYTELAVEDMKDALDDNSAKLSHDKIEHAFGLDDKGIDIVTTTPLDPDSAFPAGSSAAQEAYSLSMAAISQYEKDFGGGKPLSAISDDLLANHISSSGVMDNSVGGQMASAAQTYIDDKGGALNPVLNSPSVNPKAPASITLAASPNPGITTGPPVVVSATVLDSSGAPVPDGTKVSFAISAGLGELSGPTKTSAGIATVNLTSAQAGSVTVSASAGSATDSMAIPFIIQPTTATLVLATSGTLPSGTLIGGISGTLLLPGGVTVKKTSDVNLPPNQADASAVFGSGAGATAILVGNVIDGPPQSLGLGLISVGISAGDFGTVVADIAVGSFPTAASFSLSNTSVRDVNGVVIPGMSVVISKATIQ